AGAHAHRRRGRRAASSRDRRRDHRARRRAARLSARGGAPRSSTSSGHALVVLRGVGGGTIRSMAAGVPSTDLYAALGVGADASREELTAASRARARELHPDTNPEPTAGERFKRIPAAYDVLPDPADRARYDAGRRPAPPVGAPRTAPTAAASARVDARP